jgi:PTH1 family peptidyl-tRNA hydrolase
MAATYLVVGLGNIGPEYAKTRHNMGFMILDAWAQASNVLFKTDRYGDVAEVSFKGRWFVLLKPSTYMNLSGNAVRYWMQQLHLPLENLIVISDDLNLPFGTLRMRANGSSGGHNGLEDITTKMESDKWARIRVGIGNEFSRGGQIDYVLGALSKEEMEQVPALAARVIQGIKDVSTIGIQRAMNTVNTKPQVQKKEKIEGKEEKSGSKLPEM